MFVYLNGDFIKAHEASINPFDFGFLYGYGLFETIRVYNGSPFALGRHLNRLAKSAKILKIPLPPLNELKRASEKLIKINHLTDAKIRITISNGISEGFPYPKHTTPPTVFIFVKPFKNYPFRYYRNGLKATFLEERINQSSILSQLKTTSFINRLIALRELKKKGIDEGFYLNFNDELTEATLSNVFLVKKNEIITPPVEAGLLPGITREIILEIAPTIGINPIERTVKKDEIFEAEEIFITSTLKEVMPVVEVEGRKIGSGHPGPIYQKIHQAYKALVKKSQ